MQTTAARPAEFRALGSVVASTGSRVKMSRKTRIIVVLMVAVAVSALLWLGFSDRRQSDRIQISGNIELTQVNIAFKLPGKMVELKVEEGDPVQKGMVIARLDPKQLQKQREQSVAVLEAALSSRRELQTRILFQAESLKRRIEQQQAELLAAQARLDELLSGSRQQEIEQARAALDRARTRFENASIDWERAQHLFPAGAISESQHDQFKAAFESTQASLEEARQHYELVKEGPRDEEIRAARAQVARAEAALAVVEAERIDLKRLAQSLQTLQAEIEAAQSQVAVIETQLEDTVAVSPVYGVVLVKAAEPGEVLGTGTTVVTVGDLSRPWVRGYISETELGRVKLGSRVRATTDSYPGKNYWGRVTFISSEAEFTPKQIQTREERVKLVYRVKIELSNPNQELKLNMPVDAEILIEEK